MSRAADVMPQVKSKAAANGLIRVAIERSVDFQGSGDYRVGEMASTESRIEAHEDSRSESGEWEGESDEWERGEGSGESENSVPVGDMQEEDDGTASEEEEGEEEEEKEEEEEEEIEEEEEEEEEEEIEEEEEEGEEGVEEEGEGEEITEDEEEAMFIETAGIKDISERVQHTCTEGEFPLGRLAQEENHDPFSLYAMKPTFIPPSSDRQWLLELALVLLITTLLLTVCSRLGYEWLVRLCKIVPEKPI